MKTFRSSFVLLITLTLFTGVLYPLVVTLIGQLFFSKQAQGSFIFQNSHNAVHKVGSLWIGQHFSSERYFWSRPSKTSDFPYNAAASSGGNQGPNNPTWQSEVKNRMDLLQKADPGNRKPIPIDLVTASASGLDPHISQAAAIYQVPRIARQRKLSEEAVLTLVRMYTEDRQFLILGEPRVHVLLLNQALDKLPVNP